MEFFLGGSHITCAVFLVFSVTVTVSQSNQCRLHILELICPGLLFSSYEPAFFFGLFIPVSRSDGRLLGSVFLEELTHVSPT